MAKYFIATGSSTNASAKIADTFVALLALIGFTTGLLLLAACYYAPAGRLVTKLLVW